MSKTLASLAALLALMATAASASAESYDATQPAKQAIGYVGVGAMFGFQRDVVGGFFIDGGKRIGTTPLFLHGQLTGGKSGADGSYVQLRAGVEARTCVVRELFCGVVGVDTGYQRDQMITRELLGNPAMEVDAHDALLVPRVGLEAGTKVRLRAMAEAPLFKRLNSGEGTNTGTGIAFSVAVAGVF